MGPIYFSNFLSPGVANFWYSELRNDLDWLSVAGRRKEYWWNSLGVPYTYGSKFARTYEVQAPHRKIQQGIDHLSEIFIGDDDYEGCFLNLYESSRDGLEWHADDDPGIDHTRGIAVITLYHPDMRLDRRNYKQREIQFKNRATGETRSMELGHGSLFWMPPGFQDTHFHRIPKAGHEVQHRISMTYRGLLDKRPE